MLNYLFLTLSFFSPIEPFFTQFNTNGGWLSMTVQTSDFDCNGCGDFNLIYEDENSTIGFDVLYDGYKPPSEEPTPTLFTMLPNEDFVSLEDFNGLGIQSFPRGSLDSIKLGVVTYNDSVMLSFYMGNDFHSVTLHDKLLGVYITIDSSSTYSFTTEQYGWDESIDDRFVLHFHRNEDVSSIYDLQGYNQQTTYYNLKGQFIDRPIGLCIKLVGNKEPELVFIR